MSPSAPLRVAYVLKMYPRFSETFILNEILELERQGTEVRIFSLYPPADRERHADVTRVKARVTYLPPPSALARGAHPERHARVRGWSPARYDGLRAEADRRRAEGGRKRFGQAVYIAPMLRDEGIRHVHAHFATSATEVARQLHRLLGVGYSFTAHAKDIFHEAVSRPEIAARMRDARFAVTVSDYNLRYLREIGAEGRLTRIYNGLDLDRFRLAAREPAPSAGPPLILGVGRLVEKKGFEDLLEACALLARRGRTFRCAIVGKGEREGELRRLRARLGLEGVVRLPGPMPREDLLALVPRAAVFAAPCVVGRDGNRDGLPTVLIEAMALGVPVVSTPVTGIPELVAHERTGLLVPERDPRALAEAIESLLSDRARAQALALRARRRVEASFDLRRNVSQLRALLAEVA